MRKIMKVILMLSLFSLFVFLEAKGQDSSIVIKENTDLFHGVWLGERGGKTYEIKFEKDILEDYNNSGKLLAIIEIIGGKLTIKENNKVNKQTPEIGSGYSIASVDIKSSYHIHFHYNDSDKGFHGTFDFIINQNAPKNAVLKLGKKRGASVPGVEYDIPDNLSFRKVE